MYKKPAPNPGKKKYADLKENIIVELGEHESPRIEVKDGLVTFSRWDEDIDDRVSFVISEWDLGEFIDIWLFARMEQSHPSEQKAEIR